MAEIKEFRKKRNYDDLIFMENEEFNKVLEEYENHPKLKELINLYRAVSTEGYANLARASMRKTPETIEEASQNKEFLSGIAYAKEAGELQDKISKIISEL